MKKTLFFWLVLLVMPGFVNTGAAVETTTILEFKQSPFPLTRNFTDHGVPFFDVIDDRRRGHNSSRGGIYWEDATYYDKSVLLSLSKNFNPAKNPVIVVYLHGNQNILDRDLIEDQQLPAQVSNSGANALFVAPQFALDAQDSSAGNFVESGYFAKFMDEVAARTAKWQKKKSLQNTLAHAPVIIVAFSGGYLPASFILENGGVNSRIKGVVLLDALYSREEKFLEWLQTGRKSVFFLSAYTQSTRPNNERLQMDMTEKCIKFKHEIPQSLAPGQVIFMDLGDEINHNDLPKTAWIDAPIADLLARIKGNKFTGAYAYLSPLKSAGCRKK